MGFGFVNPGEVLKNVSLVGRLAGHKAARADEITVTRGGCLSAEHLRDLPTAHSPEGDEIDAT
jgi:hypothetical protein